MSIPISEVFFSLSGEGLMAGLPTIFIRVSGCNFVEEGHPCIYCDTPYSWHDYQGKSLSMAEIGSEVFKYSVNSVLLTGGEPLSVNPREFDMLIENLHGYHISVETNGSIMPWNSKVDSYVVDMKCPSSGNSNRNLYKILRWLRKRDQVKFVIGSIDDFEFAKDTVRHCPTRATVLISPIWGKLNLQEVWEWVKEIPQSRLSLQLHKIVWGDKKGV